jgi:glycosyltransferase involved in cell wall biosynthesis
MSYRKMLSHLAHFHVGLAPHQKHVYHKGLSAGNGRKFFAYMQASLPVVGPNFSEIGRSVEMAECGILVDTTNPQILANAIDFLLRNPEERKRLGENGRWAFESHLNWEVESQQLAPYFEYLIKKIKIERSHEKRNKDFSN